jgi:hypothetical protein
MRKLLFIFGPLLILVAIFFVYLHQQPRFADSATDKQPPVTDVAVAANSGNAFIKPGTGAWIKQYDRDGQLYYQFKSDFYDPQPDGTVKVTRPVIEFYLSEGQVLQIEGVDGDVRFSPGTDKGAFSGSRTDPPRYGNLRTVTVKLFGSAAKQASGDQDLTMTMTNAQFDNDTYRLFTQEYTDADGKVVHAEEVPVTVRAADYSFDGTGMVMYWNDLDKQLKSLEVDHCKDLTVYNTAALSPDSTTIVTTEPSAVAATVPPAAAPPPAPASPAAPSPSRHRYLATFFDNVRVVQAGQDMVRAMLMTVDFASKGQGTNSNSNEGNSPTAPPSQPGPTTTNPSGEATAPTQQPLHIYWTGRMRMVPEDDANAEPLEDGKAIVRLIGAPVWLHQNDPDRRVSTVATCANLTYHTADASANLVGDATIPLVLTQTKADGTASAVTGQSLDFSRVTHVADIEGHGSARFPDPDDAKSVLDATWEKNCVVHLSDDNAGQMQIQRADLAGNVVATHPRFRLSARDDVELNFDRASSEAATGRQAGSPPLRHLIADGDAMCIVHETDQRDRTVSGEHLELFRDPGPDGKLYAKTILCNGSVVAQEPDQSLRAEHLRIGLLPAPEKKEKKVGEDQDMADNVALDHLTAQTGVQVFGKNSSSGSGDRLDVAMVDGHPHVTLLGSPGNDAKVKNSTSALSGPEIHISPHDQTASVVGAGTFDGQEQPKDPTKKPRPVHLTWNTGANLDGNSNKLLIIGPANAASHAPGGPHDSAQADRIIVDLVDAPPATRPSENPPTTRPQDSNLLAQDDSDFMKNKQVKAVSLRADDVNSQVKVESYLTNASDVLIHQYDLEGLRVDYDSQSKRMTVPGAGRIFATEPGSSTTRPAADTASTFGGHGNTAIQWQKSFIYDSEEGTAVIDGSVLITHMDEGPKAQPIRLDADIVQVAFDTTAGSTTEPAVTDEDSPPPKIKRLTADGLVIVTTPDKTINCGTVVYNPVDQTLDCTGGLRGQVTVVDNRNIDLGKFSEAVLDLKTNRLIRMTDLSAHGQ